MLSAKTRILLVSVAILLIVAANAAPVSAGLVALEANDNIPGEPMTAWAVEGHGDAYGDRYDVYSFQLISGAPVRFACTASLAQDFNIYLYPSTSIDVATTGQRIAGSARVWAFHGTESFDFTPETTGTYYLLVDTASGSGTYRLSRQVVPTLTASGAGSILAGQTLRVDGVLSSIDPAVTVEGRVVLLYMTTLDGYLPPLETTTGVGGSFSFSAHPTVGISWCVVFDGATGLAAAASDEHITDVSNPGGPSTNVGGTLNGVARAGTLALKGVSVRVDSMAPVLTGADGSYSVSGILPGLVSVTFAKSGYVTETVDDVVIRAGETAQQDVVLLADTSVLTASLAGSVTASGAPLAGVSVNVGPTKAAMTGADGKYVVSDIAPGSYEVTFSKAGYLPQTLAGVTFAARASVTKDVVLLPDSSLDASGTLSGTVRSIDGRPLASVQVRLGSMTPTATGADGEYRFSGVVPGTYSVTFAKPGYVARTMSAVAVSANASASLDTTLSAMPSGSATPTISPKQKVIVARLSPPRSTTIYQRRAGGVRYTLAAAVRTSRGAPVKRLWVYLQTRASVRSAWRNTYRLRTDVRGRVAQRFLVRGGSTRYFRWYAPATKTTQAARSAPQRVTVR